MVYDGEIKIRNTKDIMERLTKKDEIIKCCAMYLLVKKDTFSENFDMDKTCDNMLYNLVDNLKGHQQLKDLENEIIDICNNTVIEYKLDDKYFIDMVV